METVKSNLVPAVLAFVGVRIASGIAPSSTMGQIVGGVAGALVGIVAAKKLA